MRRFVILIVLLFSAGASYSQTHDTDDVVQRETIRIVNAHGKVYKLGPSKKLQQAFGKARAVKKTDEVLDGYAYMHHYLGLEVYFKENNFEDIEIKSPIYQVFLNGQAYCVVTTCKR